MSDIAKPIRVLVAEDEEPLRDAICALIASEPGLEVIGAVASAQEAIALAARTKPDVALVDVRMPGRGAVAAAGIRAESPGTNVVALSAYDDLATVIEMLRRGAVGYLVKGIAAAEVVEAVRRAARGHASLSIDVITAVIAELAQDQDERSEALEVLRRSEERFRALIESSPDPIVIVNATGGIVLVNGLTEELFGYTREELLGKPVELLLPDRFQGNHADHRETYLADPQTRPMGVGLELAGRRKDGTEFSVDISLSAVETDEGTLVTARVRDITEDKRAAEVLRKSDERLRGLLESAPDAVVIAEADGRIVLVNEQTERLFGFARDELLGRPVELLLPDRFHERHVVHRSSYAVEGDTRPMGVGLDLAGRRKDGTEFPVDISLSTIEIDNERLVMAFVRDVTERKAAEELEHDLAERRAMLAHLVSAGEEERSRIAGDIHDDSIQAITAAGMRLQILRRSLENPEHLKLLDELERTIQLSIARLRHLLFELRPPVLDNGGLSAALEMYLDEAGSGSETRFWFEDGLRSQPSLETRTILYRITQEALTNARKHASAANVTVALREVDGGYLVRVTDDGIGFSRDSTAPVAGHLGLSAMRERATLAGGWLRIETAVGAGTALEVWVPPTPEQPLDGQ